MTSGTDVLRHRFVRAFAIGRFIAVLATQIISTTVAWQLFERTGDTFSLGLVGLVELIPVLVLLIPAGNMVDRRRRKHVAAWSYLGLALTALALAAITALDAPTPAIYVVIALVGATRAFGQPALGTIMPQLLAPGEFAQANVWLSASYQLAAAVGPGVGGLLVAASGGALVPYLVAVALLAVFLVVLAIEIPAVAPPPRSRGARRSLADVLAGFTFIKRQPIFLAAITLDLFAVLFGGAVALLPAYAKEILEVGPDGYGWLRAAPAIGAFVTALFIARMPPWPRPGVMLLWAVAGFGCASIAFGLSESFPLSLVCLLAVGAFDEVSVVIRHTLEQVITPDALRGRVSSINFVFIGFSNELGAFESGTTALFLGTVGAVVAGGVATLVVVAAVMWRWPALLRIGPLHTLAPATTDLQDSKPAAAAASENP